MRSLQPVGGRFQSIQSARGRIVSAATGRTGCPRKVMHLGTALGKKDVGWEDLDGYKTEAGSSGRKHSYTFWSHLLLSSFLLPPGLQNIKIEERHGTKKEGMTVAPTPYDWCSIGCSFFTLPWVHPSCPTFTPTPTPTPSSTSTPMPTSTMPATPTPLAPPYFVSKSQLVLIWLTQPPRWWEDGA